MSVRCSVTAFAALTLAGCTEVERCGPADLCSRADLEVTSVVVGPVTGAHPVTGLPVVDSLHTTYTVTNRGGEQSDTAFAQIFFDFQTSLMDTIAPLPAGQTATRTVMVPRRQHLFDYTEELDRRIITVTVITDDSDDSHNNTRKSDTVHVAVPVLEVTMEPVPEPRVRVNDPLRLTVTIKNHSAIAPARNIQMRHCLVDSDIGCWWDWTAFGNVALPDVMPGETRTITYTTSIAPTAMTERIFHYRLNACATFQTDTAMYRRFFGTAACGSAGLLEVLPDFEACSPPRLSAEPVALNAANCGDYPPRPGETDDVDRFSRFYVFSLDAIAGQAYLVSGLGGSTVRNTSGRNAIDIDPAGDRIAFAESGRYYFVRYLSSGTITASAVPVP